MGRNKAQYMADDDYQAQSDSNPSENAILNIFTATAQGVALPAAINVLLEYTVEWFDVKPLEQS